MQKRTTFTPEFKREAVRLLEQGDRTSAELARELGVRRNQLYKWKEQLSGRGEAAFPGQGGRPPNDPKNQWGQNRVFRPAAPKTLYRLHLLKYQLAGVLGTREFLGQYTELPRGAAIEYSGSE